MSKQSYTFPISGRIINVGDVVSFIVERAPRGGTKSGKMTAGTIVRLFGERATIRDGSGFEYTIRNNNIRG